MALNLEQFQQVLASVVHLHHTERLHSRDILASNVSIQKQVDHKVDAAILAFEARIAAMPQERVQQTITYPDGWWQALRERWLPAWWVRRFPIRYTIIDIDVKTFGNLCPHLPIDDQREHLAFLLSGPIGRPLQETLETQRERLTQLLLSSGVSEKIAAREGPRIVDAIAYAFQNSLFSEDAPLYELRDTPPPT